MRSKAKRLSSKFLGELRCCGRRLQLGRTICAVAVQITHGRGRAEEDGAAFMISRRSGLWLSLPSASVRPSAVTNELFPLARSLAEARCCWVLNASSSSSVRPSTCAAQAEAGRQASRPKVDGRRLRTRESHCLTKRLTGAPPALDTHVS